MRTSHSRELESVDAMSWRCIEVFNGDPALPTIMQHIFPVQVSLIPTVFSSHDEHQADPRSTIPAFLADVHFSRWLAGGYPFWPPDLRHMS